MGAATYIAPLEQEVVERLAHIFGHGSAAANALAEAKRRRDSGENVTFFESVSRGQHYIVVGPPNGFPTV